MVGAGAWGGALAIQAARAGHQVLLWARSPDAVLPDGSLRRLPGLALPASVTLVRELPRQADAVLLAVPVQHLREVATRLAVRAPLVACCKGLERHSGQLPLELLAALHPGLPLAVLSGPNFAREIAIGLPGAAVLAADDAALASALSRMLATERFRLYVGGDPLGVQLGGAAKNVIAIAAGAATGAGLGENARAALITRGVAELGRLIVGLGGRPETASGLSGVGDLVLTCTGTASRNGSLGAALGRGERLSAILATGPFAAGGIAEGVETAPALAARAAASGVSVPVIEAVSLLLDGSIDLRQACDLLLARPLGKE